MILLLAPLLRRVGKFNAITVRSHVKVFVSHCLVTIQIVFYFYALGINPFTYSMPTMDQFVPLTVPTMPLTKSNPPPSAPLPPMGIEFLLLVLNRIEPFMSLTRLDQDVIRIFGDWGRLAGPKMDKKGLYQL